MSCIFLSKNCPEFCIIIYIVWLPSHLVSGSARCCSINYTTGGFGFSVHWLGGPHFTFFIHSINPLCTEKLYVFPQGPGRMKSVLMKEKHSTFSLWGLSIDLGFRIRLISLFLFHHFHWILFIFLWMTLGPLVVPAVRDSRDLII